MSDGVDGTEEEGDGVAVAMETTESADDSPGEEGRDVCREPGREL